MCIIQLLRLDIAYVILKNPRRQPIAKILLSFAFFIHKLQLFLLFNVLITNIIPHVKSGPLSFSN